MDGYQVFSREPLWLLELNEYQRDNLLKALLFAGDTADTGDWYSEVKMMLEGSPSKEKIAWVKK